MGSSAKKKAEKKKDFQKAKLKVGKARPKNTNATDTSFAAKSIVVKQQSLSEHGRDQSVLINHNLSLLSSRNETQRRDALAFLATQVVEHKDNLPQSVSTIFEKALPLLLDGNSGVRSQVLRLARALPVAQLGSLESALLYVRAGLTHLSVDIRLHTLSFLDWMIEAQGEQLVSATGGWTKLLRTLLNLLNWSTGTASAMNKWSNTQPRTVSGNSKLLVHQLNTLAALLSVGLMQSSTSVDVAGDAATFPLWHVDAHTLPRRSNPYGYLNLFGVDADAEADLYESVPERKEILVESGIRDTITFGIVEARKEGGEVGRAAAAVAKALKLGSND